MSSSAPASALRDRLDTWVSATLANRAVVEPFPETEQFSGKIRGLPSIAVIDVSESLVVDRLRNSIAEVGERIIARGDSLPVWDKAPMEVSAGVVRCIRLSTLRDELKTRASEWGTVREKLPANFLDPVLVDIDQVITRHAMQLNGTA